MKVSMGNHHFKTSRHPINSKIRKILMPIKSLEKKIYSHRCPFISVFNGLHGNPETTQHYCYRGFVPTPMSKLVVGSGVEPLAHRCSADCSTMKLLRAS